MALVKVDLGSHSYEIVVESGMLGRVGQDIASVCRGRTALVVTEPAVAKLYGRDVLDSLRRAGFQAFVAEIAGGEECKTLATVASVYDRLLETKIDRGGVIVTLGGGVVGDLGGFAAATYLRGIDFVQVPTTLLAQVDASVGGKVGVDLPQGKNLVGAFYQPKRVLIDPDVLATLPHRQFASGLAELIKHGIISDHNLFDFLRLHADELLRLDRDVLEQAIARSCEIKAGVVSRDERESGLRAILNFGHTVGHGIETATGFTSYAHGEAVAIGMVTAALISEALGTASEPVADEVAAALSQVGLPIVPGPEVDTKSVVRAMAYDKKVVFGKLRFVLLKRIGDVEISENVTDTDVISAIEEQVRRFGDNSI
jgi:3-dehydroquinate synthase